MNSPGGGAKSAVPVSIGSADFLLRASIFQGRMTVRPVYTHIVKIKTF